MLNPNNDKCEHSCVCGSRCKEPTSKKNWQRPRMKICRSFNVESLDCCDRAHGTAHAASHHAFDPMTADHWTFSDSNRHMGAPLGPSHQCGQYGYDSQLEWHLMNEEEYGLFQKNHIPILAYEGIKTRTPYSWIFGYHGNGYAPIQTII